MTPRSRCVDPLPAISPFGFEVRLGRCRQADSPGFGAVLFFFSAHFVFFSSSFGGFFFFFFFVSFFGGRGHRGNPIRQIDDISDPEFRASKSLLAHTQVTFPSQATTRDTYVLHTNLREGKKGKERKKERKKKNPLSPPPISRHSPCHPHHPSRRAAECIHTSLSYARIFFDYHTGRIWPRRPRPNDDGDLPAALR